MNHSRPIRRWQVRGRSLELGRRTWVLAILNLTPDSFYPASRVSDAGELLARAACAVAEGADALDLGAESTRPGAEPVPPELEQERLLPAVAALRRRYPELLLSVDTRHAATAARALAAGADIINDVSGLDDPAMAALLADTGAGAILMHHRGDFATMHRLPPLPDPVASVRDGFAAIVARAAAIPTPQIVLDPGFGFGKNGEENLPLLARFEEFHTIGYPLLAGVSRKSFLGGVSGPAALRPAPGTSGTRGPAAQGPAPNADQRLPASLAAATAAVLAGAHWVRVHDVAPTVAAVRLADRLLDATFPAFVRK